MSKGFSINLEKETLLNSDYRRVLYTTHNLQLVLMSLEPGVEIGKETHDLDQFIRFEAGRGKAIVSGMEYVVEDGSAVIIPAGNEHNVINTGDKPLKLYTVYTPPEHRLDVVQATKADEKEEHFDGRVSE